MGELLEHLDGRGGPHRTVANPFDEGPTWRSQRMIASDGVDQNGRIEQDHPERRLRIPSSSFRSSSGSGTLMGSESRILCSAHRRASACSQAEQM